MTELLPNIFAIEVRYDAHDFQLVPRYRPETGNDSMLLVYWNDFGHGTQIKLPFAEYEILCSSNGCTEEQAASIVERGKIYKVWYRNYEHKGHKEIAHFKTALPSLQSLLRFKGMTAGNYLIIKKVEG